MTLTQSDPCNFLDLMIMLKVEKKQSLARKKRKISILLTHFSPSLKYYNSNISYAYSYVIFFFFYMRFTQVKLNQHFQCLSGQHGVVREMWKNIKGDDVKQIQLANGYPNSPAKVSFKHVVCLKCISFLSI